MRATFETNIPSEAIHQRDYRAIFQRDMLGRLEPVYENEIVPDARTRTRHQGVAAAYSVRSIVTGTTVEVGIENSHPLFKILNDGSKPHLIEVKHLTKAGKPGYLVFQMGGHTVFTHGPVNHPGTRGQHMVEDAREAHKGALDLAVQRGLQDYMVDSLGGDK